MDEEEPSFEPSDKELGEYAKQQEEFEEDDAKWQMKRMLEEFQKAMKETTDQNLLQAMRINYSLKQFYDIAYSKYVEKLGTSHMAMSQKFPEIIDSLFDSFALSAFGRYKTAYFLMRKTLELFSVAEYIDRNNLYNGANEWLFESGNPPISYSTAFKEIYDHGNEMQALYKFLCKFAHNEGTKEYQLILLSGHEKNAFKIYSEKMVFLLEYLTNYIKSRQDAT
jgi:hypothetical protein